MLVASAVWSQVAPFNYFKVNQPWFPYPFPQGRWAAHESRVFSCEDPRPLNKIALDDWVCTRTGPIIRVDWWGTMPREFATAQAQRPFYVAIYPDNGNCQPVLQEPLYKRCVRVDVFKFAGVDCQNRPVFYFSAALPPMPGSNQPFIQQQGRRYWLQISEADRESVRPNVEDFRWSGHRSIKGCPALQASIGSQGGITFNLLHDPCDEQRDDLAFRLRSRTIFITIRRPLLNSILRLSLFDREGRLVETACVEPDDDGNAVLDMDAPPGEYRAVLEGMSMLRKAQEITVNEEGIESRMSFFDITYGDVDFNNQINDGDLLEVLFNFGRHGD